MSRSPVFKRLFFWLSGAGTETLEQCPNWEQRKYVAFGATVLVPCVFAFIASAYAISTLTTNNWLIYSVAAVWSFIILTIDRALLASYRPFLSFFRKGGQFLLRFVVAILMGATIAHPLTLLLFRDTINVVVEKDRQVEIDQLNRDYSVKKEIVAGRIAVIEKAVELQRERWNDTFNAKFLVEAEQDGSPIAGLTSEQQIELKKAISEATSPAQARLIASDKLNAELTPSYTKIQQELAFWQSEFEREVNGQRSGILGLGPRARSIQDDQLAWRREEAKRLGCLIERQTTEKGMLQAQAREAEAGAIAGFEVRLAEQAALQREESVRVADLRRKVEQDQAGQFVDQQNQIRATIKQQIDSQLADLASTQLELARIGEDEQARLIALRAEPRRDILTQTLALHRLFDAKSEGGQFAMTTYIVLTLLFMLVDTIPLMVKFFCKSGPYDMLLDRDEVRFDADHKAFLGSHGRYMLELARGNHLAVTRNKPLEEALLSGVEHTRAAREFLNSLIELEKAFHDKLLLEQEAAKMAGPEKIAVLEQMKKRFYEDLHLRMENFFNHRHGVTG